jgi:hypothetical protein
VAYSTAGDTTLGSTIADDEEEDPEAMVVRDNTFEDRSIMTEGSTESQIWNAPAVTTDPPPVIDNMDMLRNNPEMDVASPAAPPASEEDKLAYLMEQIAVLQATNEQLLAAAAAYNNTQTLGSHPTSHQPEKAGVSGEGDGGMH